MVVTGAGPRGGGLEQQAGNGFPEQGPLPSHLVPAFPQAALEYQWPGVALPFLSHDRDPKGSDCKLSGLLSGSVRFLF